MTTVADIPDHIAGDGVVLRPLRRSDAPAAFRWLNNPAVMAHWSGVDQPVTRADVSAWIEGFLGDDRSLRCLVIETPARPIGFIELSRHAEDHNYRHLVEIDICIGEPDEWDRGLGSASLIAVLRWLFTKSGCERAFLQPRVSNNRAVHVYEKVGFRKEGVIRRAELLDGEYHDALMMAALRDEWLTEFGQA